MDEEHGKSRGCNNKQQQTTTTSVGGGGRDCERTSAPMFCAQADVPACIYPCRQTFIGGDKRRTTHRAMIADSSQAAGALNVPRWGKPSLGTGGPSRLRPSGEAAKGAQNTQNEKRHRTVAPRNELATAATTVSHKTRMTSLNPDDVMMTSW